MSGGACIDLRVGRTAHITASTKDLEALDRHEDILPPS